MAQQYLRWIAPVVSLAMSLTVGAASSNNDDGCDIAVLPAATLLLPYFEVELDDQSGETTLLAISNVTNLDAIARVTLWTDRAYPVLTFNVYLTGYDVQALNLYITRMQSAFTEGTVPDFGDLQGCNNVGNEHDNAVGYATIDLVRNCSTNNPFSEEYWTEDLAFENVLIGDHQQIHSANNFAQGSPMVHVRAIPEGGTIAERRALPRKYDAGFPRTFYARYQPALSPKLDGRQPLPSVFAARWIEGGASGFETFMKIWREGKTGRTATCAVHDDNVTKVVEMVVFDEAENAVGDIPESRVCTPITVEFTLPATSLTSMRDSSIYPQLSNGAIAGWVYMNLDHCEYTDVGSNNWVVSSMRAEGRYSVDMDAAALGNGCSPQAPLSEVTTGSAVIGPRPNVIP